MSSSIPKLRFTGFSGEWEQTTLGSICEMQAGKFIAASQIYEQQNNNKYPCYGGNGLRGYTDSSTHNGKYPLIGRQGALCGNVTYAVGKFYATEHAVVVTAKHRTNTLCLYYQLIRLNLNQYATGQAQPGLSVETIKKVPLALPLDFNEQKKIADFLSAIDCRIEGLETMMDLQKRYKQGVMQRIFNQTIRFKDDNGKPFPDWQERTIKKIGEVVTGGTPSKDENQYWGGDFVWVTAQDFKSKYIYNSILKLTTLGKNKSRIIPPQSILVTCIASIGLNAINRVECSTNQQINAVICNDDNCTEFIYYAISYNTNRLKALAGQTAMPIISKSVFESFTIQVPKSKDEQKRLLTF